MHRWTLDLGKGWSCFCDAEGSGRLLGPNGENYAINDHKHAILFVRAHREGTKSFIPDDGLIEAFEVEEEGGYA